MKNIPRFQPLHILLLCVIPALIPLVSLRFQNARENSRQTGCSNQLKMLGMALALYSSDYDDKYPPAVIVGSKGQGPIVAAGGLRAVGWADALFPYTRSTADFNCPSLPYSHTEIPTQMHFTPFWLNGWLAGLPRARFSSNMRTISLGEGDDGHDLTDASYSKKSIPTAWLKDPLSPLFRHPAGANYLMVDGRVVHLDSKQLMTFTGKSYSLAPPPLSATSTGP